MKLFSIAPLEWHDWLGVQISDTNVGNFSLSVNALTREWVLNTPSGESKHHSEERAKATAEQCYSNRVRACLVAIETDVDILKQALYDAHCSLRAISELAGKDEFMEDINQIRAYANNRANVAKKALGLQGEE